MKKALYFGLVFCVISCFFIPARIFAKESFVTVVNPVRGKDFWNNSNQQLLDWYNFYHKNIDLPATWLLRPDFLLTQDLDQSDLDELGLFLEVTPSWADEAGINYHQGGFWSQSSSVFLSGYSRYERKQLIQTAFESFKNKFGHYPKTVGAWHIDPYSADFMREKYEITSVLICADQYQTDTYQIWGGWWGVPYYPRESNLLLPANNQNNKLNLVVLQWAARDPVNGYGPSVDESTYSVQVNDYKRHRLGTDYFKKLSDFYLNPEKGEFGQLTVGIENDYSLDKYIKEYTNMISVLRNKQVNFKTAKEFSNWYRNKYKNLSPEHRIGGKDPLGSKGRAFWEMNTSHRLGLIGQQGETLKVRDFRDYGLYWPDPYLWNRNLGKKLYWNVPSEIDTVKDPQLNLTEQSNFKFENQSELTFKVSNYKWVIFIIPLLILIYYLSVDNWRYIAILFPSSLIFCIPVMLSGRLYSFGLGFWGPSGHDAVWHLGLVQQLKKFKFINPGFGGTKLLNYHWGSDLIIGLVSRILTLTVWDAYFRFVPILLAVLTGILSFIWGKRFLKSKRAGIIFGLLNFFAGSFGWVYNLISRRSLGGESLFWSMQSISTLINLPFAFSLVIFMVFVLVWRTKKDSILKLIGLGALIGILVTIKIYAAILLGLGLGAVFLYSLFDLKNKRIKRNFLLILFGGFFSFFFMYFLGIFNQSQLLVFKPLWFTHSLIESLDKLYYPKLASFRFNLASLNWSLKKLLLIPIELFLVGVFVAGNFGTRVLGFLEITLKTVKKKVEELDVLLISILIISITLPLLFVQKGTAWNTIQFLYYGLFIANFYFASYLNKLISKRRYLFTALIVLLTILTTISTLKGYLGYPSPAYIPYYELQALEKLKKQPSGTVLRYPYDQNAKADVQAPIPLYLYETNLYVSAYAGHVSYLADEMNLEITGYPWRERKNKVLEFFETNDKIGARGFLLNNNIDYIYLVNNQKLNLEPGDLSLREIFNNGLVRIYQVNK